MLPCHRFPWDNCAVWNTLSVSWRQWRTIIQKKYYLRALSENKSSTSQEKRLSTICFKFKSHSQVAHQPKPCWMDLACWCLWDMIYIFFFFLSSVMLVHIVLNKNWHKCLDCLFPNENNKTAVNLWIHGNFFKSISYTMMKVHSHIIGYLTQTSDLRSFIGSGVSKQLPLQLQPPFLPAHRAHREGVTHTHRSSTSVVSWANYCQTVRLMNPASFHNTHANAG